METSTRQEMHRMLMSETIMAEAGTDSASIDHWEAEGGRVLALEETPSEACWPHSGESNALALALARPS